MEWLAIRNGELLALASEIFDAFITVDQNLAFQNPIVSFPIAVIVLRGKTSRLKDIEPLVPPRLEALERAVPATVRFIEP